MNEVKFKCGDRVTIDEGQIAVQDGIAVELFGRVGEVLDITLDRYGTWCRAYFADATPVRTVSFLQEELKKVEK